MLKHVQVSNICNFDLSCLCDEGKKKYKSPHCLLFPFHLLQAQKGKKKKGGEEESLISCYTCGLETEDPEVDQVSVNEMLIKLIMVM